jgi:hypothetical protein
LGVDRTSFIGPPHDGQIGGTVRRLMCSTTTGFVRPWLKLMRAAKSSSPILIVLRRT